LFYTKYTKKTLSDSKKPIYAHPNTHTYIYAQVYSFINIYI